MVERRPSRATRVISIFPVRNVSRTLAQYQAMGFAVDRRDAHACANAAEKRGVVLHVVGRPGRGREAPRVAYLQLHGTHVLTVERG
jgi:hypothetical protein